MRVAQALKGIDYEYVAVNLLKGGQLDDSYTQLNAMKGVSGNCRAQAKVAAIVVAYLCRPGS